MRLSEGAGLEPDPRLVVTLALSLSARNRRDDALRVLDRYVLQAARARMDAPHWWVLGLRGGLDGGWSSPGPQACAFFALSVCLARRVGDRPAGYATCLRTALDKPEARAAIAHAKGLAREALLKTVGEEGARYIDQIDYDPADVYAALAEIDGESHAPPASPTS
jgi:hypothetical protein